MVKRTNACKCGRCCKEWKSALAMPKQCPFCHRRDWNKEIIEQKLTCKRCGKSWISNSLMPKTCAKCNNPNWNKSRYNLKPKAKVFIVIEKRKKGITRKVKRISREDFNNIFESKRRIMEKQQRRSVPQYEVWAKVRDLIK
jgi:hypothetical protein